MSYRFIKGWVPKSISADDLFWWSQHKKNNFDTLTEEGVISKFKGKKADWQESEWPPQKVTITVVVE